MTEMIVCAKCQNEVTKAHKDDCNTQIFKCPKCGFVTDVKKLKLNEEQKQVHYAFEVQTEQNGELFVDPLNPYTSFCNKKGAFKPAKVAEYLKANFDFKTGQLKLEYSITTMENHG